jgi:23S rRNA (uridine2552-2'-O)-methyltransferase
MKDNLTPPINIGDEIDVKIEAVGVKGDGIAKMDNFVVFVKGAELNNTYKVKVAKVFKSYAFAEIM